MSSKSIPESAWKWYGLNAHFICGRWCRFHLATKVGRYLVSTVGKFVHPSDSNGGEITEAEWMKANPNGREIGHGTFYETMVFKAGKPCAVTGCDCGVPVAKDWSELDAARYVTAGEAQRGHYAMCRKWARAGATS